MKKDTLAALEAEGTSPSEVTASAQEAAPETPDNQGDAAKLKQELETAKQEARYQALARKVDVNEFQFRDVFASDRKAAARIAKEKWGITPEEVLAQLSAHERAKSDPEAAPVAPSATDFDAWYAKKRELESSQRAKEEAIASLNLSEEDAAAVEQEFGFLENGRRLDAATTKRLVLAAFSAVKSGAVSEVDGARRTVSSIVTVGQSAAEPAQPKDAVAEEVKGWKAQRQSGFYKNWYSPKK